MINLSPVTRILRPAAIANATRKLLRWLSDDGRPAANKRRRRTMNG
jgi:hypothetical protein